MINNIYLKITITIALSLVFLPSYGVDNSLLVPPNELTSGDATIETIVVTGRRDNQLAEHLIGAVGRVSPEEIERMGHAHISQAASRLAGVWLSRGNGQELLASVRSPVFTGAGSCAEILTTEDGLPIRPTGMCNVNQLFEVNSEQASALEIWRGPGTVFYGSNAMHGVINSVSPNITRNYLSLQTGSHDYHRAKVGWKGTQENQEWQIAANGVKDGGFKDQSGFDQQKISLKHKWSKNDLSVKTHLSHVNLNQETAGYIKGFESYKDSSLWKKNPNPEAYRDANATRLSSNISGTSTSGTWQLTPYVRKSSMTFLQHYLPGQPTEANGQKSAGVQSSYQMPTTNDMKLWAGADIEWADMWVEEFQDSPLGVPDNVRYQGQHYDFEVNSQQFAIFANAEWRPLEKVTIEAGLRYELLEYDYTNNMIDGSTRDDGTGCNSSDGSCRYYRPSDRSDKTDDINFQLGIEIDLTTATSVYTRLSSAYRAPQINELYRLQKEQEITTIKPEQLDSIEAGIRYRVKQWYAELAVYSMDKDQVIVKDPNSYIVNDGQTSHRGIEWKLRYQLHEDWQITSTGAWSKHQYTYDRLFNGTTIDGNDIDTAPRWQGGAQLLWEPSGQITAELEWVYLGKYFLDPQNSQEYAGHNILNLTVQKRYIQWDFRFQVTNLGDRRIADRADYAFGSYRYFVGEGRGLSLELKRQF